jgi:hypothetical protein
MLQNACGVCAIIPENCQWTPVSEEHETFKAVAARTVHARKGWQAGIEEAEGHWRADVLARRGKVGIAIEIQLSPQSNAVTLERNHKFMASSVVPLWLKGRKNHENDFEEGLQERILGDDLHQQTYSVLRIVENFLSSVERQIEMARAVRDAIAELPGWGYQFHYFGQIPTWLYLSRGDQRQTILLGELGAKALPFNKHTNPQEPAGTDEFGGAVIQLRMKARALRGYGCYGFQIDEQRPAQSARRILHPILKGHRRWMGRNYEQAIPGSFIHYTETCTHCLSKFLRVTHAVIGNPRYPTQMPLRVEGRDFSIMRALEPAAKNLASQLGLPLGPFYGEIGTSFYPARPTSQACPQCSSQAPASLVSEQDAALWPHRNAHFNLLVPMHGKGWMQALRWNERAAGDIGAWDVLLEKKFKQREQERDAERKRREEDRKRREAEAAEQRKKMEEDRTREAAERKTREDAWKREQEQARQNREREDAQKRRATLVKTAEKNIRDVRVRNLWLNTSHPKMKSLHPVAFAAESDENLKLAIRTLESLGRR